MLDSGIRSKAAESEEQLEARETKRQTARQSRTARCRIGFRSRLASERIGAATRCSLTMAFYSWKRRGRGEFVLVRALATICAESNRTCGSLFLILLLTAPPSPTTVAEEGIANHPKPREITSESSNVCFSFFVFPPPMKRCSLHRLSADNRA